MANFTMFLGCINASGRSYVVPLLLKYMKPLLKEKAHTVDLLVLTSLDRLLFIMKISLAFVTFMRSTVLSLRLQIVFPVGWCDKEPWKVKQGSPFYYVSTA
jgi:hypothetical protein